MHSERARHRRQPTLIDSPVGVAEDEEGGAAVAVDVVVVVVGVFSAWDIWI